MEKNYSKEVQLADKIGKELIDTLNDQSNAEKLNVLDVTDHLISFLIQSYIREYIVCFKSQNTKYSFFDVDKNLSDFRNSVDKDIEKGRELSLRDFH